MDNAQVAQARRATGLLVACLVLTLSQPPRGEQPHKLRTRQLAQVEPHGREGGVEQASGELAAPPHPLNISGTYRGSWNKQQFDAAFGRSFLAREEGLAVFKLSTESSYRQGVHNVAGELVLRDGMYASEADVLLRLQAVYVSDVGKLVGVLEPASPITLPLPSDDVEHLQDYRHSLREAASSWLASSSGGSSQRHMAATTAAAAMARRSRQCQFSVELVLQRANDTKDSSGSSGSEVKGAAGSTAAGAAAGLGGQGKALEDLVVNGTIASPNCGVVLGLNATTTHIEVYYSKAVNYTVMITVLAFVQIMLLVRQMEASSTQALASKVSLLTIGQQAVLDAYLCLLHLTVGIMVEPLFNAFATAAFFEFVIFAVFQMRWLLSVWRAQRGGSLDPWTAQRELSILYGRFYGALLGGILLSYYLQRFMKVAVFLLYSFFIPQIVHCVRTDCRQPLQPLYVVGMSLTRLALPLYLFSCPKNLLRVAPSHGVSLGLTLFVGAQAGILLLQYYYGSRCFIPKRFLPPKYDYYRAVALPRDRAGCSACDIETGDVAAESVICPVCINPVSITPRAQRMVTPCDHFFHPQCLQRWMNVKMECPTCRRVLPPL